MSFDRETIKNDNICVIWIDDLIDVFTWRDSFGVAIKTPNLDRFMQKAVRFKNTYATVPLCAPCRAEMTTGISPFISGLVDLNRVWRDIYPPTMAWQYDLKLAGFRNFTTGKTDATYKTMPEEYRRLLFDVEPPCADNGGHKKVKEYLSKGPGIAGVNHPNDDGSQDWRFYDHQVAQNAIDYLKTIDPNQRHLIQLGFKHPHYNLRTPDRFYELYDPAEIEWPKIAHALDYYGPQPGFAVYEAAYITNGPWIPEKAGDEAWRQVVRAYFAAISHMDYELGRFLDAFEQSPIAQNTTIILFSDNGFNLGNHDSFHKMSQWDSAAHIPLGIRSARLSEPREIDLPISLHNIPKTIMDLAGLPPRANWKSGQSLLPLIDPSFGAYDRAQSPMTSVFGTLSVRPSIEGYTQYRYFRYPNGEEHVYDLVNDPGETTNIADTAPLEFLRGELVQSALRLGLDLRGFENPAFGVNAMMAVDGSVVLAGGIGDNHYWAYGSDAEKIKETKDGGYDTLWYLAGPDDYVLHAPANIEKIRMATVVSREEKNPGTPKTIKIIAHPDSPINFETTERVTIDLVGSSKDDVISGPKYGGAVFYGGAGNDRLIAESTRKKDRHYFYGEEGDDTLIGGMGADHLDGGAGDDVIHGGENDNVIIAGTGNDHITDGTGNSEIYTGPGRNSVTIEGGRNHIFVGAGINKIKNHAGHNLYEVAFGGQLEIVGLGPDCRIKLVDWPEYKIEAHGQDALIQARTAVVLLKGITTKEALAALGV